MLKVIAMSHLSFITTSFEKAMDFNLIGILDMKPILII